MKNELPPGLRVRTSESGIAHYYLKLPGNSNEMSLGPNRREAVVTWQRCTLERWGRVHSIDSLVDLIDCFIECELPVHHLNDRRAVQNQADRLRKYFQNLGDPQLNDPIPGVEAYLDYHGTARHLRSGAEIHLLAHIFGWAKRIGVLAAETQNPLPSGVITIIRKQQILVELGDAVRVLMKATSPQTGVGADDALDRLGLKVLQQKIAAQLVCDGRRDLARHLRSLNEAALKLVLFVPTEESIKPDSSLVLGTGRSERLAALRRQVAQTRRVKIQPVIAATHKDSLKSFSKK